MKFECYKILIKNLEDIELIAKAADTAFEQGGVTGRTQGNAMTRAALVLLCGYLEGFVRDIAEEYIDILNDKKVHLEKFPEQMFCSIVEDMATNLRKSNQNSIGKFKAAMQPEANIQLNKKLFSKTGGNPSVDTIETLFDGLGLPNIIDKLSINDYLIETTFINESQITQKMREDIETTILKRIKDQSTETAEEIIQLIELRWHPKQKRRKVGYVNEIEQLLKKRNRIAHGEGSEQITPSDLRGFLASIEKLASGLHTMTGLLLKDIIKT